VADITAVRPVRKVYLGLTANPYDALSTVVWTEVPSAKVKATTLKWGAQHELARVEPSRAMVALDNVDGDFEALNTASPYYPNLRPLNRLRIVDTWAGVDYIRFTGYVTDWPRSWTGINQSIVQLEAYDALGAVLNAVDIPAWPWEMEIRNLIENLPATGKAVWLRLNESSGTVAADSSGFGLNGQYQGSPTLGVDGFTPDGDKAVRFVTESRASLPYKNLITGYPFTVACWFRAGTSTLATRSILMAYDGPSSPRQLVQVYVSGQSPTNGYVVADVASALPTRTRVRSSVLVNDNGAHFLVVAFESSTSFKLYLDGVDRTTAIDTNAHAFPNDLLTGYSVGNTPAVAFGDFRFGEAETEVLDEVLVLDGVALSAAQVDDLYESAVPIPDFLFLAKSGTRLARLLDALGWPTADRSIAAGLTSVQQGYAAGKALAYAHRLDVTEGGRLFVNGAGQIVFQDRHAVLQAPYTVSQATFGEGVGEIGYVGPFDHGEDDADIYNDVRVANVGGVVQVARNKASKDRYGWKTLNLTDLLGNSDEESRDRANRDLAIYSEPTTRIRQLVVKPQEDAAQGTTVWPNLLGLGQNSRVTVKAQPPGAPLLTQESHVERLEETVTPKDWQITLGLSAAQAQEFAVWGTSTWGGARWSY
jgi:hypothetical protein